MIDFDELDEVEPEKRPYDLVIYGATGYSGCLAVEHLDALLSLPRATPHRWAIAGRSDEKLQRMAARCQTRPKIIVANTKAEIDEMAEEAVVVLALAGPYLACGEQVLRACVEKGTHYIDITGEVNFSHFVIQKYHQAAKEKGIMIVQFAGAMSVPDDLAAYLLVRQLGPLKQLRVYTWGFGLRGGGSFQTGMEVVERMLPESMAVYHNPFSLGGERQKAARSEDNDCRAAEADPLFPSTWVMPAYGSHTTSRVLRRSCGLFDEWQDAPCYGEDLLVVVRDLALDKKDADYAVWANPVPADIKDTMKQSRTMEEMRNKSLAPHPGLGPPQEARALGFMESYLVAEAESGDWSHVHFLGGDGFEVTAITCTCAALVILEEFESLSADARGVLTPAAAFHGSSLRQRLEAHAFGAGAGQKMSFEVLAGKPAEEKIVAALTMAAKRRQKAVQLLETGSLQAWDVPSMIK